MRLLFSLYLSDFVTFFSILTEVIIFLFTPFLSSRVFSLSHFSNFETFIILVYVFFKFNIFPPLLFSSVSIIFTLKPFWPKLSDDLLFFKYLLSNKIWLFFLAVFILEKSSYKIVFFFFVNMLFAILYYDLKYYFY